MIRDYTPDRATEAIYIAITQDISDLIIQYRHIIPILAMKISNPDTLSLLWRLGYLILS